MTLKKIAALCLLLVLLCCALPGAAAEDSAFGQGSRQVFGDVKVVNLQGTWREMGRQYGFLMQKELKEVCDLVEIVIGYSIGNAAKADSIIDTQIRQTPYRIAEFFQGAAETSGLSVYDLQKINAVERIAGLPHCSVAMAWGDYAAERLTIGRNYDYSEALLLLKDDVTVTVFHPADGSLNTAIIGYAGEIYAVNGLNEKGLFLELNNGKPSANIKSPDARVTGTTMLFSVLFEADEMDDLDLFFNTVNCSSSYIINAADSRGARSYEWCPVGVKRVDAQDLLVSTNYFVHPDWLFATPSDDACWEGLTRRANLLSLCEEAKGRISPDIMKSIIETKIENGGAMNELTVYQMVVEPETLTLWMNVVGGTGWTEIPLGSLLLPEE